VDALKERAMGAVIASNNMATIDNAAMLVAMRIAGWWFFRAKRFGLRQRQLPL
jgi:hypothetical protein